MSLVLRPYQAELVEAVNGHFRAGVRAVCLQAGTGSGKTATASEVLRRATARGYRSVFLAHLDALIEDTHARLAAAGIRAGFLQADRPTDPEAPVQVASLQTLHVRGERPPADLIILDECHRSECDQVQAILRDYPVARLLGLTATPQRGDGRPLGGTFQELVAGPTNRWLTEAGFIVPCDVLAPESYLDDLCEDPVALYARATPGQRAIAFAASIAHGEALAAQFTAAGFPAALITGETPRGKRRECRAALRAGTLTVLVGVGVFIEGWDSPEIEVVVIARGFGVPGAFLQAIGRGLRPSPETGKKRCTVLDPRGNVNLHGLPDEDRVWSLTGAAVRRVEKMPAVARCSACWAMFRPAARCPRCGAEKAVIARIPRVLSNAEKAQRWTGAPQNVRDARYLATLVRIARERLRMDEPRALRWAGWKFEQKFGRRPAA